ncbi:MAG: transglycosylase SLT domain-containing protein [Leptospirales bacterium]
MRLNAAEKEKAPSRSGPFPFSAFSIAFHCFNMFFLTVFSGLFFHPSVAMATEDSGQEIAFLSGYIALHSRIHLSQELRSKIAKTLLEESHRQHVALYLAVGIVQQESGFDPKALNAASKDYGLFQVHFSFWRRYFARQESGGLHPIQANELFQIPVNVRVGMMILRHDLTIEGNDVVRGIGLYSGRKGFERATYVERVFRNEVSFLLFHSLQERIACSSGHPVPE